MSKHKNRVEVRWVPVVPVVVLTGVVPDLPGSWRTDGSRGALSTNLSTSRETPGALGPVSSVGTVVCTWGLLVCEETPSSPVEGVNLDWDSDVGVTWSRLPPTPKDVGPLRRSWIPSSVPV